MGSCAAPSAKGDDKFITTDYLQQCPQNYLESGKLVRVFADELSIPISAHHLVYPRTHQFIPKIELFLNWIHDELSG
ncbi:hypothetical protein HPJ88_12185 [Acinetobacter baumannii]|nr:hypothetical protein [Acinetobacter baumannii]